MNRAERLVALLNQKVPGLTKLNPQLVAEILAIADDRPLMSLKDFADHIGRNRTTILSWIARGSHDVPRPVADTGAGFIWDGDQVTAWAELHPELKRESRDPFKHPPRLTAKE